MQLHNTLGHKNRTIAGLSPYETYEEKRLFPRIDIDRRVLIRPLDGNIVYAIAHDISPDGLQIRCDRTTAHVLHPSGKSLRDAPSVDIGLPLPLQEGLVALTARCTIRYFALISEEVVVFWLNFEKLTEEGSGFLDRFIVEAMEPSSFGSSDD